MKSFQFLLLSLFFAYIAASPVIITAEEEPPVPSFANIYTANGTIRLPYAEIVEPFSIWYDGTNNRSRIDYYDGTMKTYQRADLLDNGVTWTVVPFTNDSLNIQESCFELNGTSNSTVSAQSVFPNITQFKYLGPRMFNSKLCDVWENIVENFDKVNTYRFWGITDKTTKTTIPVRYEMFGYDSLFGSHYDKYEIIYDGYEERDSIDETQFKPKLDTQCHAFLGPGRSHHVVQMNPMHEFVNSYSDHVDEMFEEFKDTHQKSYANDVEHSQRKMNYLQNLRFINSHNRAGKNYQLALNHMADWGNQEFGRLRGRIPSDPDKQDGLDFDPSQYDPSDLPDNLDWRLYGAVTPVKDQAICGSCWSYGTSGALEGAYFVKNQKLVVLSQQALIDCSWIEGNNGCNGGEDYRAYRWIKDHGLPKSAVYGPYLGIDGKCHLQNISESDRVYITNYVNVTSRNVEHLKLAMFNNGPISVSIDASHKTFSFYSNGVYEEPECKTGVDDLDHSVLAVGYGVIGGKPYWLIKNSWSTYWGNDGYVLMSQKSDCGVTTQPTYVIL